MTSTKIVLEFCLGSPPSTTRLLGKIDKAVKSRPGGQRVNSIIYYLFISIFMIIYNDSYDTCVMSMVII